MSGLARSGALAMALVSALAWAGALAAEPAAQARKGSPAKEAMLERLAAEGGLDAQKARDLRAQLEAELSMRALLERKAVAEGLDKSPQVAASLALARQNALAQAYLDKVERALAPSEAELRSDYDSAYPKKRLAKVKFAIYASEPKAQAALASLSKGSATIEELAKLGDDQLVAQRQGDFGSVGFDAMPDPVAAAINAAPARKWPAQPIKTVYGHVVYELSGVEEGRERSFEQARPELEKRRRQMMMRVELAKIKEEARKAGL